MAQVVYSALARADLADIWWHIANNGGLAIADQVIDWIERRTAMLARHPEMGPARPDLAVDARSLVVERWLVLYRVLDEQVQVMRVVDGARDLRQVDLAP